MTKQSKNAYYYKLYEKCSKHEKPGTLIIFWSLGIWHSIPAIIHWIDKITRTSTQLTQQLQLSKIYLFTYIENEIQENIFVSIQQYTHLSTTQDVSWIPVFSRNIQPNTLYC